MQDELVSLLSARKGHFQLESGHHGDLWFDLDPLFLRPGHLRRFTVELARRFSARDIDAVCGPLVGGAFLAQMVAVELDVEFYYAERIVRAPGDASSAVGYRLPSTLHPSVRGKPVAIVDDVINAGSAVRGTFADLQACGARPVAIGALLVLGSSASSIAADRNLALESIGYLANDIWAPSECPLCASNAPLENAAGPPQMLRG